MINKHLKLTKSEHKKNLKELRIKKLEEKMKINIKKRKIKKLNNTNG